MDPVVLSHRDVLSTLPDRLPDTHKGHYGKVLLLCGSQGYTGAASLAAMGALRCGAGLVYLGVPRCIYTIEAVKLTEPIIFPLPDFEGKFSTDAFNDCLSYFEQANVLLLGPGIGRSTQVQKFVHNVLRSFNGPIVLDADGINAVVNHIDILRERTCPTVLTPHAGEFARIGGRLQGDRTESAINFAKEHNIILLLKGNHTIITDGTNTYINPTGNPGMATGGSGDVLSGIIAGLIAQSIDPLIATASAAWLHGKAGDLCAAEIGQYGMLPSDMLQVLPRLMK